MKEKGDDERDSRTLKHHVSDIKRDRTRKSVSHCYCTLTSISIVDIRINSMLQNKSGRGIYWINFQALEEESQHWFPIGRHTTSSKILQNMSQLKLFVKLMKWWSPGLCGCFWAKETWHCANNHDKILNVSLKSYGLEKNVKITLKIAFNPHFQIYTFSEVV